jgi:hypothetical protein
MPTGKMQRMTLTLILKVLVEKIVYLLNIDENDHKESNEMV